MRVQLECLTAAASFNGRMRHKTTINSFNRPLVEVEDVDRVILRGVQVLLKENLVQRAAKENAASAGKRVMHIFSFCFFKSLYLHVDTNIYTI